jgi:hypothetical protein
MFEIQRVEVKKAIDGLKTRLGCRRNKCPVLTVQGWLLTQECLVAGVAGMGG